MDRAITEMISRYKCETAEDYRNALKEIIQEITLLGLWRAKFFEHAAFYGGTALRMLHGLGRFSEDLDFTLLKPNAAFSLRSYFQAVEAELLAFGFEVTVSEKRKRSDSTIESAFLKAGTKEHVLKIGAPHRLQRQLHSDELVKIKMEIDVDPSGGYATETCDLLYPVPFWVGTLTLPSLFAGKMHAVLCRQWKRRVKGRDWYDMLWFIQNRVPVRLQYLEEKMRQTGYYTDAASLTREKLIEFLIERIQKLDIESAKEDVVRFIENPRWLEGWSEGIFTTAAKKIQVE